MFLPPGMWGHPHLFTPSPHLHEDEGRSVRKCQHPPHKTLVLLDFGVVGYVVVPPVVAVHGGGGQGFLALLGGRGQ